MIDWLLPIAVTLANAAAAGLSWWFCRRAAYHKRAAKGSAAYAREARTDARRAADEAKKFAAGVADDPILPFIPAAGWHEDHGG